MESCFSPTPGFLERLFELWEWARVLSEPQEIYLCWLLWTEASTWRLSSIATIKPCGKVSQLVG